MNRNGFPILSGLAKGLIVASFALIFAIPLLAQDSMPDDESGAGEDSESVVLISLVDRQLAVIRDGEVVATFQVAVGADVTPSPTGTFKVVSRVQNPAYYHPGIVIPAGKDNPLGSRWLGLSQKGYGIHGTNSPKSIGHAASHGCIRLRNRDIEKLFTLVNVGDAVEIRGERDELTARIFGSPADDLLIARAPVAAVPAGQ